MPRYRSEHAKPKTAEFVHHSDRYRGTVGEQLVRKGRWNDARERYDLDEKVGGTVVSLTEAVIEIDGGGWIRFPGVADLTITEWE